MPRLLLSCLMIGLLAATAAQAQIGGGGGGPGGGGGGGHGRHGGGQRPSGNSTTPAPPDAPIPRERPVNQIAIIGVVRSIAPDASRITIAHEPVDELNWPAGTQPFPVAKPVLLKGVTVGEKVRFWLDSEQISDLKPF
jgi:hypothetical protein